WRPHPRNGARGLTAGKVDMSAPAGLAELRVIEFSRGIEGAYCARLLANGGADVIKIEDPCATNTVRLLGPFQADKPDRENGGLHAYLNAGKRGMTLDVETMAGR